ncbi:MAG: hypothetical protein ACREHD_09465, partial [Pirellulales bacterium]
MNTKILTIATLLLASILATLLLTSIHWPTLAEEKSPVLAEEKSPIISPAIGPKSSAKDVEAARVR